MAKLKSVNEKYNPSEIESKWQAIWEKEKIYSPNLDSSEKPFYNLMMFPYPSAEGMHVGNMYAFTGADVYSRFQRMQGKDVFEPIGLDGFGIHSENYAIKAGKHPAEQAKISEINFYRQLKSIGNGFDWTRTVETYKPEYYKWTQWLFIQLFKAGLAYRKKAPVNFCPSCKTVLSDEQVIDARCERCNSAVEKKDLEQWFFRITKYADRLLSNLTQIDWAEKVKTAQREWIGRSEGTRIEFKIQNSKFKIDVFTTRADTLYGATFLILAPEHPFVSKIQAKEVKEYVAQAKKKTDIERTEEKTGVFTGLYAINPVNQEKIPVWIADYALMDYGTGALFGDAHDKRDVEFAKKYGIPLKLTIITGNKEKDEKILNLKEGFTGYGTLVNSGQFSGLTSQRAIKEIATWLEEKGSGGKKITYHLRDWLISRQRYWGPPIPLVFCENCAVKIKNQKSKIKNKEFNKGEIENPGWIAVDEKDLPVKLPFIEDYKPLGTGQAPLASHPEFYRCKCPKCGGAAKRETDVSDTFLDSSWYFLRYLATERNDVPFPSENGRWKMEDGKFAQRAKWLPVNMYIGGAEHSVLHLLYSRFITMVLKDLGFIGFEEPFTKFRAHGLIIKDGAKMSKSKGNVVIPDSYIKKFGADAMRCYLMFTGPFNMGGDFRDSGIEGMFKFLNRVWNLIASRRILKDGEVDLHLQKLTEEITEEIKNLRYNTAISRLMMYYNFLVKKNAGGHEIFKSEIINYIKMTAPFAPHLAEEMWRLLGQKSSVHVQTWPSVDKEQLKNLYRFTIAIQINGKTRATMDAEVNLPKDEAERRARPMIGKYIEAKKIKKIIYVEGKVINFVVA